MDNRKAQRRRILDSLFDFLKVDFNSISDEEKIRIIDMMFPFFMPPAELDGSLGTDFGESYSRFKEIAPKIEKYISQWRQILSEAGRVNTIQEKLKAFFNDLVQKRESFVKGIPQTVSILRVKDGVLDLASVSISPEMSDLTQAFTDLAVGNIFNLLVGLPVHSIKMCAECKGFYVHLSQRKRIYCSPQCTSRALVRKMREGLQQHPRKRNAYRKKQAEIMWRTYPERVKEKTGIKKPKINRRVEYTPKGKKKIRKEG